MKIVTNMNTIKRNKKIGQYTTIASLVVLGAGLIVSFKPEYVTISFAALLVGFVLSQVGIYFGTRWGRSPRPDEKISQALKGLEDKYTLYHYETDVPHLLVGPAGIWALIPFHQGGTITYDTAKGRWKQKGGNLYMKIFAQESLGRPDNEVKSIMEDAQRYLSRVASNLELPPVQVALIFTSEKANIQADEAPVPTLAAGKLKDFIRRKAKETPAPIESIKLLQKLLPEEEKLIVESK